MEIELPFPEKNCGLLRVSIYLLGFGRALSTQLA